MAFTPRPVMLFVLDGFGIAPASPTNAVSVARKPFFDSLIKTYPSMLLNASGMNVGLPNGEVGNSEVGHITIGSGILRYQNLPRIDKAIEDGSFFTYELLGKTAAHIRRTGKKLHLIGLIGNGGVHASQKHLNALLEFSGRENIGNQTFIHAFVDGRDTAKDVGAWFMSDLLTTCQKTRAGQIASVGGRLFGMDRNKNWDRTQKAYNAIFYGNTEKKHTNPVAAIQESYAVKKYDEEMEPVVMVNANGSPIASVEEGDVVIFFNFRADRARQLTQAMTVKDFDEFETKKISVLPVITFTEYEKDLPVGVLFPTQYIENPLGRTFADSGLSQLHIAETEKYAHVTFFMNGMREQPFEREERILIPSPAVESYDLQPEMSAVQITDALLENIAQDKFNFYAINYANPDMVGHTGNLSATVKAVESVDQQLARIIPKALKRNALIFLVADHGNAEELVNPITGDIDKEHNNYPVPFIVMGNEYAGQPNPDVVNNNLDLVTPVGILADVAPTILTLSGLPVAPEMNGFCLL
jgi:2,3-bisphosphoglycerate-independent phosphoglycerate mutase